ncbi:MAG: hypothetical protein SFU98_15335 [Leptospiraceae bacterium]|nr:hypothetical protein [Leptospiraceae bacterium]
MKLILVLLFIQCSTYAENRRKDTMDIVTIGGERNAYGFGLRISYLTFGFFFQGGESELGKKDLGDGYGLRGGSLSSYHSQQLIFGVLGGETYYSGEPVRDDKGEIVLEEKIPKVLNSRDNLKSHKVRYLNFYSDPPEERTKRNKEKVKKKIAKDLVEKLNDPTLLSYLPTEKKKPNGYGNNFPFQVEIFLGTHYGLRLGFNIAEFLDFVLGFTTLDILEDDENNE